MALGGDLMTNLLVLGMGYAAAAAGQMLLRRGWEISGTARSQARLNELAVEGFYPIQFDEAGEIQSALRKVTHLLISTPPGAQGDPALKKYGNDIRKAPALRWAGYLSTIGVYGDRNGCWVDEETPAAPSPGRGEARADAERAWTELCNKRGLPLDIFRLAGIYGPGRSPLERIAENRSQRVIKPGQVFNRIHVDDIAQTIIAAISKPPSVAGSRIFNVSDDEPAPPQDVILYASTLIGAQPPEEVSFEDAALSPMARSFYEDNKRVRNDRIKRELGVVLKYPTYREGLAALAEEFKRT